MGIPMLETGAMQVRNQVRQRRVAAGLTQVALAQMVGVTRQTIISVEQGGYAPSVKLALQLAEVLQMSVAELFWLEPDRSKSR